MKEKSEIAHTTSREIEFVDSLGTHHESSKGLSRREMLHRYKQSMSKRVEWGEIDPYALMLHVNIRLEESVRQYYAPTSVS